MKVWMKKFLSVALAVSLLVSINSPSVYAAAAVEDTSGIDPLLKKPYLELLELAPTLQFTSRQFDQVRARLKDEEKAKKDQLKAKVENFEKQIKAAQDQLKQLNAKGAAETPEIETQRQAIHCQIQNYQDELAKTKIERETAVPVEFENYYAKLDLIEKWPAAKREIAQMIASNQAHTRKWGDAQDIGFRTIVDKQEDDIKAGQEAVQQLKQFGMLPKEIEDPVVTEYVNRIAQNIARNSDLKVPLHLTVLNSKEVNAFALPGGYLFVNRGLLEETQTEAQLAGVLAHEISHDVARHGNRLMKRATIASIVYQAAQVAALIFTGGAAGIGTYYALQYGFQGLGLVLSLQLLGVSRDYELEADLLGVQYLWKAGYNPEGFIQFFDLMASKEGYVEKTSFFRTHPAFYDRIVTSYREISFLPAQEQAVDNTSEFQSVKAHLKEIQKSLDAEDKDAPTLYKRVKGCEEPNPDKTKPPFHLSSEGAALAPAAL
jgi:Zn-dependent protease with chaperone function